MVAKPDEVKQIATQAVTAGVMRVVAAVVDPKTAAAKLVEDVKELPLKAVGLAAELPMKAIGHAMELQAQVGELPKIAAGLPLKLALQAVATGEKVRNLLPGHSAAVDTVVEKAAEKADELKGAAKPSGAAAWDAAAPQSETTAEPKPAPEDYRPPLAGSHTAQAATVRAELKAVPAASQPVKAPAAKAPARKAPTRNSPAKTAKPLADAPVSEATHEVLAALADTLTSESSAEPIASVTPIHAGRDGHVDAPLPVTVEAAVEAAADGADLGSTELPLADYGSLSITQIRSRISKLDAVQLVQLRDYERAHADRAPIVTLLETKLAKVTAATSTTVDTASTVSSSAPGETAALIAEAPSNN